MTTLIIIVVVIVVIAAIAAAAVIVMQGKRRARENRERAEAMRHQATTQQAEADAAAEAQRVMDATPQQSPIQIPNQ